MPTRFRDPRKPQGRNASGATQIALLGEWWPGLIVFGLVAMVLVSLSSNATPVPTAPLDTTPQMLEIIAPARSAIDDVARAYAVLCREPVLLTVDLAPDCETGAITLADDLFEGFGGSQLREDVKEDVTAGVANYLALLAELPALWDRLEALEIRGHADPRAVRDPYTTNLVGSQQRALGVLLHLIGPTGLAEPSRETLQALATVSGASYSRPPADCPERSRECYPAWRRVEIRPVLSEALRRRDWSRTVEDIDALVARQRAEASVAAP